MKKKIYAFLILALTATQIFAQCGARYKDMIFSTVTKTSDITYSTSNSTTLKLDVYEPAGDTASMRPLIILAHGGSFYGGSKTQDGTVVTLCNNFAKRGYVCASIDYRLGDAIQMYLDSSYAIEVVLKALSDGKSAIRFFRKDAATTNTYRIDPNHIFAGGNSAGAVLFMHSIYVDSLEELTPFLQNIINQNGGYEGNSGNDGYSSDLKALINLAGGLNVPEFVGPGNKPSVNFQGTNDNTVSYNCAYPINGAVKVRLCGLGAIEPLYQQYSIPHVTVLFPGDGHCPWDGSAPKFTKVDTVTRNFLYDVLCGNAITAVENVSGESAVNVYPNPAADRIHVYFSHLQNFSKVQLVNIDGCMIEEKAVNDTEIIFSRSNIASGLYFIRILRNDGAMVTRKIILQ